MSVRSTARNPTFAGRHAVLLLLAPALSWFAVAADNSNSPDDTIVIGVDDASPDSGSASFEFVRVSHSVADPRSEQSPVIRAQAVAPAPIALEPGPPTPPPRPGRPVQPADIQRQGERISLRLQKADLADALEQLGQQSPWKLLVSPEVKGEISVSLKDVTVEEAIRAIVRVSNLGIKDEGNFVFIYTQKDLQDVNVREGAISTRIYKLKYVRAADVLQLIAPFLVIQKASVTPPSRAGIFFGGGAAGVIPATNNNFGAGGYAGSGFGGYGGTGGGQNGGQPLDIGAQGTGFGSGGNGGNTGGSGRGGSFTGGDDLAGGETLIVQDYEKVLEIVDQIIAGVDVQPEQVIIEAVIIEARLNDQLQLGINWAILGQNTLTLFGNGAAINAASGFLPAQMVNGQGKFPDNSATSAGQSGFAENAGGLKFGLVTDNITAFIRALEQITQVKVLASPQILVLNKQPAELLIGDRLGFRTLTVNFTSTVQNVDFLEVGTILRVRPFASPEDGMIRMEIRPERSTGQIVDGLPQSRTQQVTSNVMVPNGLTVVMGGLIEDTIETNIEGVPYLDRLPKIGALFRRRITTTSRRELVVLLTPRIWKPTDAVTPPRHWPTNPPKPKHKLHRHFEKWLPPLPQGATPQMIPLPDYPDPTVTPTSAPMQLEQPPIVHESGYELTPRQPPAAPGR